MPLDDFLPGGANAEGVDTSRTYLIKGTTLKRLLARLNFNPQDFRIEKQGENRTVHLADAGGANGTGDDFDVVFQQCGESPTSDLTDVATIYVRNGLSYSSDPGGDTPGTTIYVLMPFSCADFSGP